MELHFVCQDEINVKALLGAKVLALELRRCGGSCLGGGGGAWEAALPSRSRST